MEFDPNVERLSDEELKGINWFPGDGTSEQEREAARRVVYERTKANSRDLSEIAAEVKERLTGQWSSVLGLDLRELHRKGKPCPRCGKGHDRFHAFKDSEQTGGIGCRKCPHDGKTPYYMTSNGIDTYAWLKGGMDWSKAVLELAEQYGIPTKHDRNAPKPKPLSIIEQVARAKRMPVDAFTRYGVQEATRAGRPVARVDVYNEHGEIFSYFDIPAEKGSKGLCKAGRGNSGLFLPGRRPMPGETWCITEGVKDSAALLSLGYLTIGLPTSTLYEKYAPLLAGVNVICVPDLDTAGMEGAERSQRRLYKIARSVSSVRMPGEVKETDGDGVREVLARIGPDALKTLIDNPVPWKPPQSSGSKHNQREKHREELRERLRNTTDQWSVMCVLGEPNMFRLIGEFFDKAGDYLEMPIETLTSFSKFQNCIAERCRQWLDPDFSEVWAFIVQDMMKRVEEIDGGIERAQTRLVANTIFNWITSRGLVDVKTRISSDVINDGQYCGISRDSSTGVYWVEFSRLAQELDRSIKDFKPIVLTRCMEQCKIEYESIRILEREGEAKVSRRWRKIDREGLKRLGIYGEFGDAEQVASAINDERRTVNRPQIAEGTVPENWPEGDMQYEPNASQEAL